MKAVRVQQRLLQRFPEDVGLRNKMGVSYLIMNQMGAAKEVFKTVLDKWPDNGFAMVGIINFKLTFQLGAILYAINKKKYFDFPLVY